MTKKQIAIVTLVTLVVVAVHSSIPQRFLSLHIVFRLLYFIPIIIVALATGRRGGLIAALVISLTFLPHFFFHTHSADFTAENFVAIVLFISCGFFVGNFRDSSEISLDKKMHKRQVIPHRDVEQKRVLFYIDESPLSIDAAKWFSHHSHRYDMSRMSIVLLTVSGHNREEILADTLAGKQFVEREEMEALKRSLVDIRQILIEEGIDEKNIETIAKTTAEKVPISDKIIECSTEHEFDFILLCKHNKSKSEEFLFGDTAIQVLRKATVPVLAIKGIEEQTA